MSPPYRVAQPYCLALAPQIGSVEPVWYIAGKVLSGEEKIFYSQIHFDANYPELSAFTKTVPNAPRSCFVTFGPGYSYFASAPGRGSVWAGIPSELSDKIQKAYDTPCCVSLGKDNAWFVMWPDGYYAWKFHGHYSGLDKILTDAQPRSVSYLAISPYNKHHYFVAFRDRTIKYNFTGAPPEWMQQMQEVFNQWQAEIAQQIQPRPQTFVPPNVASYAPHPQPWNPYPAQQQQPPPPTGYSSPQLLPNSPMSNYSSPSTPSMSPIPPAVFAHHAPAPQFAPVEMMGSMPQGPPQGPPPGSRLVAPDPQPPVTRTSSEKKKKFLSKIFS
ncbi:hypothetical protein K458DRAFT_411301 [Lentithecium fluviatile CBS 122367]|uniref:Uncharacterized protein n=1 Tax=Lentithecium fluviatile CBS 122367 TaxID=1168545 RepID=A0A6G1JMX1_9PLEO|nr:hypothetical protein K458DRAFT_411301 [Lentithecium fluviatile CBS 122367]